MGHLAVYTRVLRMLRPERGLAIALALANLAVAGLQFFEPILFGRVIDLLTSAAGRSADSVWADAVKVLGLWVAVGISGIVANILVSLYADRMAHRNRLAAMARYFEHVLSLPFAFHNAQHSGRLLKIMLQGVDSLFGLWLNFFRDHLATAVALFVMLPLSLFLNWRLGLLLVVLIAFYTAANIFVVSRASRMQSQAEEFHSQLASQAGDALGNVHLIQSFVRLSHETRMLRETIRNLLGVQFPVLTWWAILTVMTRAAATVTTLGIFVLGTWLHLNGLATVGEIVSFMGLATMLIGRMDYASNFVAGMAYQTPTLGDFFNVLETESTIREKLGARDIGKVEGAVEFDNVSFSYDGKRAALRDFSLSVKPGTTVALVGPTGAGKSTSMALLHRMWDPQAGTIRVDGTDIRDVTLDSLRRNIGVVFQDNTMFYRSIADNLRVGRQDATDAELAEAARLAEAHEFIERLNDRYKTQVGERGATLSGGERQRLSIARALLKNPPILILDEATSALDTVTEAKIQQALKSLMKGRTTFIIAHRLSTIRDADLIVAFEQGRAVEIGRYGELMAKDGAFARLVATQQAGLLPGTEIRQYLDDPVAGEG
jgi:ATP-binding cassette subfamily B protein